MDLAPVVQGADEEAGIGPGSLETLQLAVAGILAMDDQVPRIGTGMELLQALVGLGHDLDATVAIGMDGDLPAGLMDGQDLF